MLVSAYAALDARSNIALPFQGHSYSFVLSEAINPSDRSDTTALSETPTRLSDSAIHQLNVSAYTFSTSSRKMSSSFVIEPQESASEKKDNTLIIIVNDDGTISVDQETLQSLISKSSLLFHWLASMRHAQYIAIIDFQ